MFFIRIFLLIAVVSLAHAAPDVSQVAPGVWRLRFATPDARTPMAYHVGTPLLTEMAALPSTGAIPFPVKDIVFSTTTKNCSIRFPLGQDENLYGFGLTPTLFVMNGHRINVRPTDSPENPRGESHAPVPLYFSTRGYAVYVDTARFAQFFCGVPAPADIDAALGQDLTSWTDPTGTSPDVTALVPNAQGLDIYIFEGPTLLDAVRRYNLYSGGGPVPPLWGLGIWYEGLGTFSAAESLNLAASFRDDQVPCDVWGVLPGWQSTTYPCSFVWNSIGFPDPVGFMDQVRTLGYHTNFWEHAFTSNTSPIYAALQPFSGNCDVFGGRVPDFASPDARQIFLGLQEESILSKGGDGFKLDECDDRPTGADWSFPANASFPSGLDGERMHLLFGVLYQQTMLTPLTDANRRTWGLVRNSGALATSLPYGVYSDSYDHRGYIRSLLNEGFSGLMWVPEVREASSLEDLYRRIELAIFAPIAQVNAWYLRNPPWLQIDIGSNNNGVLMPNHAEVTAVVRELFQLRMSLIPYLYSAFNEYHRTGMPPIRPLVMDWPADPTARIIDDEFMLGPSLLVAPRVAGVDRQVYLPAGTWYDFWTKEKIEGSVQIPASTEDTRVPMFVKENSIIPWATPVQFVADDTRFEIVPKVYGEADAECFLYEDDGLSGDFENGNQNVLKLLWKNGRGTTKRSGGYLGSPRYQVAGWPELEEPPQPPQHLDPIVSVAGKPQRITTKRRLVLRGTASTSPGAPQWIEVKVRNGAFRKIKVGSSWRLTVPLVKGVNMVWIRLVDDSGAISKTTKLKITRR